ncbi:hypothetical protein BH11PSE2_BH11PSE2_04800 [soil metagenome]
MKLIDYAKAFGVGLLLFALNMGFAIAVIFGWSILIEPGHDDAYYNAAALRIAPWCSYIIGTSLFLLAGWLSARRKPERNALVFALVFTVLYALIDTASVGFADLLTLAFPLSNGAKLVAALAGAALAARSRRPTA